MAGKRILVIAAHPDDEVLGCGGTIALHTRAADKVTLVIVCEGESLRYGKKKTGQDEHIKSAAQKLGIQDIKTLNFPDQKLDTMTLTEIIKPLEEIIRNLKPQVIYCQHGGDVNRDHQILFQAVLVAARPIERYIEEIFAFDSASSTEWAYPQTFNPDTWVDISTTLRVKLEAMACYKDEVRDYPHPRSLEALEHRARAWGNQCCMDAAEVFMTVRRVARDVKTI